ncbi:MAG: DUF4623 domain-containing protein [Dysgonamonadaceae bacterium]|jgi:hypothetical protein|nr:DUF4623 domain-containing protein [Dysgonamonadaceae bacterium]
MKTIKYLLCLLLLIPAIIACKEDPIVENPSGETIIYSVYISNGGLSGGTRYNGTVDEAAHMVTFTGVSAETDIQHLKFNGKISLGAHFDKESYDFLEGQPNPDASTLNSMIRIVSGENTTDYKVALSLDEPQSKPMVNKIEVQTASGKTVNATIDLSEKMIYLNTPNETEVTVKSVSLIPLRTTYTFTNLINNKLSINNPGYIQLDFMGITDEYRIFFDDAPAAGINFGTPIIHDFSLRTTAWLDFTLLSSSGGENTRSADFDGEYVLIVSRGNGNVTSDIHPKLLTASSILANTTPKEIPLSTNGITGGTYWISSGRLSQGHIYICNLSTALADTDAGRLKLYHYATPGSDPEVILNFNGIFNDETKSTGRFGDNISIDLDEDGNGYVFFGQQTVGEVLRFTITGFTTVSEPLLIKPAMSATYYTCYNKVGADNEYVYTSTVAAQIKLLDKDGAELAGIDKLGDAAHGTDAHIINYNSGRYLIMTSGRQQNSWAFPTLFVYDITTGFNTVAALVNYSQNAPEPVFSYQMGESAASGGCSGIAAWAPVDGRLCLLAAAPRSGFVLIEFPKNQK